jgi:hypothetical protein
MGRKCLSSKFPYDPQIWQVIGISRGIDLSMEGTGSAEEAEEELNKEEETFWRRRAKL